jgi:8-oxo-dGTP diphosphatase
MAEPNRTEQDQSRPTFTDADTWFASLPGVVVAAGALITDTQGRVLLVKPNYRALWSVPGGICEFGEAPHVGCHREVAEEIGLDIEVGMLLAVDWSRPYGTAARPIMHLIFDGGRVDGGDGIVLQEAELDDFRFTAASELEAHLPAGGLRRVTGALRAISTRTTVFLPHEMSGQGSSDGKVS